MKIRKLAIVLFASIVLPAISLAAECTNEIDYVLDEVLTGICAGGTDLTNHRNGTRICEGLESKLEGARDKVESDKLVDKKVQDALDKLSSFQATIDKLAGKGIITGTDQSTLTGLVDAATTCVNGLFD